MELLLQMKFREDPQMYLYLKQNSYFLKELDRGKIDYKQFANNMKIKYKKRVTDKISTAIDNIDLISNVIEVLK